MRLLAVLLPLLTACAGQDAPPGTPGSVVLRMGGSINTYAGIASFTR